MFYKLAYKQRIWRSKIVTPYSAAILANTLKIPLWVAKVICHRGYIYPNHAKIFLNPHIKTLPNPTNLIGLSEALDILLTAIIQKNTIGIVGDYDADGITATAIIIDFFRKCEINVLWEIPNRISHGYGFSSNIAQKLKNAGSQLIITLDCGITDYQGVNEAKTLGLNIIITDHHNIPNGPAPPANVIINPQYQKNNNPCSKLSGVGIAFYLIAALRTSLRNIGYFSSRLEPNLRQYLDLVAIGTMADVTPILNENRILVSEGIKVINETPRLGIKSLCKLIGLNKNLNDRDLVFSIIPRLNAAGRLNSPNDALILLLCNDPYQALSLAQHLEKLNYSRRELEKKIFKEALNLITQDKTQQNNFCLVVAAPGWHRGVLGIIAARLVDYIGQPAIVLTIENDKAVGSARSLPGFNIQHALCKVSHLLTHFGGHSLAAGLTLPAKIIPKLISNLSKNTKITTPPPKKILNIEYDAEVELAEILLTPLNILKRLSPFGPDHSEPLLYIRKLYVQQANIINKIHLKLKIYQNQYYTQAIGFNCADLLPSKGSLIDLICTPYISNYGSQNLNLKIIDLRLV